jgi:two-component system, sensor histidine kinase
MVKARLLVVDDEPTLIELFTRRLERLSYHVFSALSGETALDILQHEEIDVLVTDFQMPGMDGCEIITRAMERHPMLQSIVITGYSNIKTAINAMGAGAFNYLQKPVDFNELDITIQKSLEKRKLLLDVQNKQRQLEEYHDHLKELVEKRTLELTEANQKLRVEIEERKSLEKTLREAKIQAEKANKAKSAFLANMSHEIRTPMTSAIGLLNLVLDTELLPKQKAYLEMARISTVVMHNLLNDILDLSKIDAGKLNLESLSFNPRKVIESVIDLQHLQAEEKTIQLTGFVADDVPNTVVGDQNRLRQIILNLVSNAIKFTQYGEVVIECRKAAAEDQHHIVLQFSVRDSGIGIEKEKLGLIFEAFTQADSSTTRRYGGVGLGLNICSKLVAMMGGRIWVVSTPGRGSTFHFTSRYVSEPVREERGGEERERIVSNTADAPDLQTATVLIVEDDQTNQWVIQEILQNEGYIVINASDGMTALREIENHSFDLILLDLKLPGMDGYEVVRQIRTRESRTYPQKRHLPIIALTGLAGEEEKQRCLDAGMDDFLAKPFSVVQLISKTQKYTSSRSTQPKERKQNKARIIPNTSILDGEIFSEKEAMEKASGNREILAERIRAFISQVPPCLEMLRKAITADGSGHLQEQGVHNLKEMAMEIGASNFADEVFSLLMQLRNRQDITNAQGRIESLEAEFGSFQKEPRIQDLLHYYKEREAG